MIYWAKFFVPLPISLVIFVILFLTRSPLFAESFLGGSAACILGQVCFFALLIKKIKRKKATGFLKLFFLAEWLKLSIYALAFVGLIRMSHLQVAPALLGFVVTLVLFWLFSFKIFR